MMKELIENRKFDEAFDQVDLLNFDNAYKKIFQYAYENEDLVYYEFIKFILDNKKESAELHYYASELMAFALNILPNGYQIAYEHAKKAIELSPNDVSLKEYILLFNEIPDKLLDHNSALKIARDILTIDKENAAAKKVAASLTGSSI